MKRAPFATTLEAATSRANKTGEWRVERPVFVSLLPPCTDACTAGESVQEWLSLAEEGIGGYEHAWRRIVADNPLPAVMGRVCYHPCQTTCNRAQLDEAVGINAVERFLGDRAIECGWRLPSPGTDTGRHVLVVGAGPAGLAAAYHLRQLGHRVTVRDAQPEPGGMMRYGIPAYRLPREVLDAEVSRILDLGVTLESNYPVRDAVGELERGSFDAVYLAVGAQLGKRAYIPAGDAAHVLDALSLLRDVATGDRPLLGRRVIVYGGGNTAMDAARTARRLGASDALVVYRRTRQRMPAHDIEVREALDEGVHMQWLTTVQHIDGDRITVERMRLDDTGFPQPTGELEELDADTVVLALGQESDLSLIEHTDGIVVEQGYVQVDTSMMTGHPGVFAGGDAVAGVHTVTAAVGAGRATARRIDEWLRAAEPERPAPQHLATYDRLTTWYYSDAPHAVRSRLEPARRLSTFDEVVHGLDESTAVYEARRCMSCGNCFGCDNCYGVCPDNAIRKLSDGEYEIDYDYCKGCGLCAAECPCGAIEMLPEPI